MTYEMFEGFIRHILTFGGGWMVAKGWIDETTMLSAVGAIMTLLGTIWSMKAKGWHWGQKTDVG